MTLDERKNKVLQAIIEDYVATAEPVGSRTIARKYHLGVSPATIRNEMSDLEELGYLEQPHTSAGRIPSDRGYRYYVDCLMENRDIGAGEEDLIRRTFERKVREVDTLVRETARLLSETTHLTTVVAGPQISKAHFRELRLVPLGGDKAVLVYITDSGFIENQVFELPVEVTMLELQRVSEMLNDQLRGQPVETLSRAAIRALQQELHRYGALLEQALQFLGTSLEPGERQRLYLGGTTHMLNQPEFRDVGKVRNLLTLLEDEQRVSEVLATADGSDRPAIQIGEEIKVRELADCSIVSATYRLGGDVLGRVGVIGPKRMEYARVVGIMNSVTKHLADAVERKP
ncbi:MAG TPA: heat-inducible transcriptional repressor HrcA [Symbiobacteriaceae bacterium]|nr:heat-inducible transcriptional repressor HrcA [Symbiobacteriaceae bacterium]